MSAQETPTIILGSSSPWRRKVLENALIPHEVMAPNIDERSVWADGPYALTAAIACAKSKALLVRIGTARRAVIVTADQVVTFQGKILGKPKDADEARAFLRAYRNRGVECITTVVVTDSATQTPHSAHSLCTLAVGDIPDEAIEHAIANGAVLDSCGAIVREDPALAPYFKIITGTADCCDGLPLELTRNLLAIYCNCRV